LGGPLHFNVHWLVFDSDQGNRYDDRLAATFSDDSVPGPSNSTSSPPSNYQRVPNIEWDNFYDLNLPFCPKGPQNGSVTYEIGAKDPAADPGGLAIIFHWTYSCDCACAEKEPLKVSYEFQPTPPLVNSP
jgi:hypothetical protein